MCASSCAFVLLQAQAAVLSHLVAFPATAAALPPDGIATAARLLLEHLDLSGGSGGDGGAGDGGDKAAGGAAAAARQGLSAMAGGRRSKPGNICLHVTDAMTCDAPQATSSVLSSTLIADVSTNVQVHLMGLARGGPCSAAAAGRAAGAAGPAFYWGAGEQRAASDCRAGSPGGAQRSQRRAAPRDSGCPQVRFTVCLLLLAHCCRIRRRAHLA